MLIKGSGTQLWRAPMMVCFARAVRRMGLATASHTHVHAKRGISWPHPISSFVWIPRRRRPTLYFSWTINHPNLNPSSHSTTTVSVLLLFLSIKSVLNDMRTVFFDLSFTYHQCFLSEKLKSSCGYFYVLITVRRGLPRLRCCLVFGSWIIYLWSICLYFIHEVMKRMELGFRIKNKDWVINF